VDDREVLRWNATGGGFTIFAEQISGMHPADFFQCNDKDVSNRICEVLKAARVVEEVLTYRMVIPTRIFSRECG